MPATAGFWPPVFTNPAYRQQIRQSLGGMLVAAVPGVDHRDQRMLHSHHGGAFLGMAHGTDIGVAGDDPYGVGHALALGGGGGACVGKTDDAAAQPGRIYETEVTKNFKLGGLTI